MAYARNRFQSVGPGSHILGTVIEYDPSRRRNDSQGNWKWVVLAVLLVASFVCTYFFSRNREPPLVVSSPETVVPAAVTNAPPSPAPEAILPPAAKKESEKWAEDSASRSARARTLLQRLADAERQGRLGIAVDTVEKLRTEPCMADLDDKLARRLGAFNIQRLFSGEPVPWTAEVTVRRGQTVHRIAREHGTTVAAVRRLNGLGPHEEPVLGRKLRVLEFPHAAFVIHKKTRHADLTLNGKLFKRYYVHTKRSTVPGAYPITSKPEEGPRSRFAALGVTVAPADMLELDMFLAPGSALTISEM